MNPREIKQENKMKYKASIEYKDITNGLAQSETRNESRIVSAASPEHANRLIRAAYKNKARNICVTIIAGSTTHVYQG